MNSSTLRADLAEKFADAQLDENMLSECVTLCQNYNLSAEDLFYRWEAVKFNNAAFTIPGAVTAVFNPSSVATLKAMLQSAADQKRKQEETPQRRRNVFAESMKRPKTEAGLRFMRSTAPRASSSTAIPRVTFKGTSGTPNGHQKRRYRYMYEKISERSEVLDEQIDEFAELVKQHYNLEDLGDPASASEQETVVVGRICNDADSSAANSPRLNDHSCVLESSRMMGSGARVPLRFDAQLKVRGITQGAGGQGLFPGAIVAFKGKNGGGGCFVVSEILRIPPLTIAGSLDNWSVAKMEPSNDAFSMAIACGPYTAATDLKYKPLASLFEKFKSSPPAVLLLLGPFVDASHPLIKSGDIDNSLTEIFQQALIERTRDFLSVSPDSLILLVPNIRDVMSDHVVFPQCELGTEFSADPRLRLLPNPCRFTINNVSFAATSVDVLFHLRNQEFIMRGAEVDPVPCTDALGTDVLANECRHLLQQRSFYPIYPVPVELSHEVNLDVTHSEVLRLGNGDQHTDHAPDVLIVPSRLKHFCKVVDSTVAINPSFVTKSTYALVNIRESTAGSVKERTTCEVLKL